MNAHVFGLSEEELRPVVEEAAGELVSSFGVSVEHEVEGFAGFAAEKLIPTFRYVTAAGRCGGVTVFAKHAYNPASPEPEHYRHLAAHGVPLPRLYGVVRSPQDRPVLFLEYLDMSEVRAVPRPPELRFGVLSLMARFNAVRPSPEYAAWLQRAYDAEYASRIGLADEFEGVWEHACRGDLGEPLRRLAAGNADAHGRLRGLAGCIASRVAGMELGLVSGDFSFGNTGRRWGGERVMFDVEGIGLGARFTDVAGLVGVPVREWAPEPCPPREALAEHYLDEYERCGGARPPLEAFLAEAETLWLNYEIGSMGFGASLICSDSPAYDDMRDDSRAGILRILTMLLDRFC